MSRSLAGQDGHNDDADAGGQKSNLRSKSLVLVKIWCLLLIFIGTFIGGVSPYFLKWNEGFLVLGTQFGSSVFLGTALMHFLIEAFEKKDYPFASMLACAGYLLAMLADSTISHVYSKYVVNQDNGDDVELQVMECSAGKKKPQQHFTVTFSDAQWYRNCVCKIRSFSCQFIRGQHLASICVVLPLCVRAIGIEKTTADAWKALWTISLHKIFAAIAMGIAVLRMIPDRPFASCVAYAFPFAISSPIGVAIGIIIDATAQGPVADSIASITMGLACGVFIFVSIKHLSTKGYFPQKPVLVDTPFYKFLAVSLGIGVIAVVMIRG